MSSIWLRRILLGGVAGAAAVVLALVIFVAIAVQGLPSEEQLADYQPPITTRVHAGDGSLIAEFAREQRVFVPIEAIPETVKNAFLSAEDKKFYEHGGIDFQGLVRATAVNILSIFTGDRLQGASTITQQVAKNMLLTSDRTITRKVKEAFLAQRIEKAFTKDRILELYLNEIYLGQRAYGVAAAALNYFDKPLADLTIAEAAYLAALPKGPNNYHPVRRKERAIERRNYVISQMVDNGFVSPEEGEAAKAADLVVTDRLEGESYVMSAHFVEELRRQVLELYGEQKLYDEGLSIRSTLDTAMQVNAARALRRGLEEFDRRRGWRGPIGKINLDGDVEKLLSEADDPPLASGWLKAVVLEAGTRSVKVRTQAGAEGSLSRDDVTWAAQGARGKNKDRALVPGAVIYVAATDKDDRFTLKQAPEIEGAIVAMDVNTGRVKAMVGGYTFGRSEYNRVTQARRQPGSAFKPVVYSAALDYGLTPATLVDDSPFQIEAGGELKEFKNYTEESYGAQTLRSGLQKSLNLMTVRLSYEMGMERVSERAALLGTHDRMDPFLANSLGASETTVMRMAAAYATFVNGGKRVTPILFDRIQDRTGQTVYRADRRECAGCDVAWDGQQPPVLPDTRDQIVDPITAYQVVSMLEGAVQRGTGTRAKVEGLAVAGKTGTTNDYKDAWFVGFTPNLVIGVWVGYDQPKSMGEGEAGGRVAAPIFAEFVRTSVKPAEAPLFRRPSGVRIVRVDERTGLLPGATSEKIIDEYFRPDTEPVTDYGAVVFGASAPAPDALGQFGEDVFLSDGGSSLWPSGTAGDPAPGGPPYELGPPQNAATPGAPQPGQPPRSDPPPPPRDDEPLSGIF